MILWTFESHVLPLKALATLCSQGVDHLLWRRRKCPEPVRHWGDVGSARNAESFALLGECGSASAHRHPRLHARCECGRGSFKRYWSYSQTKNLSVNSKLSF